MHDRFWDTRSANAMASLQTEAEGLAIVRRLLADGWNAEYLSLGLDFDEGEEGDDDTLPPVVYGTALAERARAATPDEAVHST
jgi:hypothetical protein